MPDKKRRPRRVPVDHSGVGNPKKPGFYGGYVHGDLLADPVSDQHVGTQMGLRGPTLVGHEEQQATLINLEAVFGQSEEGTYGADVDFSTFHVENGGVALDLGQVYGHAHADGQGNSELSAGMNFGAISANSQDYSEHRHDDWESTIGLSAGSSFGIRTHSTDEDGDGVNEVGFGFDLGPLSVDIKSESFDIRPTIDQLIQQAQILERVVPDPAIRADPRALAAELDAIAADPVRARAALEIGRMPNWAIDRLLGEEESR